MNQISIQDYIDKIIILENCSQRMKNYSLMNPLKFDGNLDIIEIQRITKLLIQHIGYDKLIFTVVFKDFDKKEGKAEEIFSNTAGNVLLDDKEDVLIHISRGLDKYPDSILATLSHEISHKYIHFNGLTFNDTYENEIFTDLTSVYLGFGKLMLNGVEVVEKIRIENFEKTYTKTVGYLKRDQLAIIYLAVNYLQGISKSSYYSNLKPEAFESVKKIEKEYNTFLQGIKYYRNKTQEINNLRYQLAYLMKLSIIIDPPNILEIKEFLKNEFTRLNLLENKLRNFKKEYLTRVLFEPQKSKSIRKEIPLVSINFEDYHKYVKLNRKLIFPHIKESLKSKDINIISCPSCKKNLRVKTNNVGIIVCPDCNFKFAVDSVTKFDNKQAAIGTGIKKIIELFATRH